MNTSTENLTGFNPLLSHVLLQADDLHIHFEEQPEPHFNFENSLIIHVGSAKEYLMAHIPTAVFCDYQHLVTGIAPFPGAIPEIDSLIDVFSNLGIDKATHVIAYDSNYGAQAGRLLWTLEYLGHPNVSVLNGGLQNWAAQGYAITQAIYTPEAKQFTAELQSHLIADKNYILDHLDDTATKIVDARSPLEYQGAQSKSARKGHIPGALNLNWQDNINPDPYAHGQLKDKETILAQIQELGLTQEDDIIVHCQTHQRSSHLYMVLRSLGFSKVRGYANSWAEWGNDPSLPIE